MFVVEISHERLDRDRLGIYRVSSSRTCVVLKFLWGEYVSQNSQNTPKNKTKKKQFCKICIIIGLLDI